MKVFLRGGFDVVYAHSVFHHFVHLELFLNILSKRMESGGIVLTRDPLQTWMPYRLFRKVYRPFQSDSPWEHPFTSTSLKTIQKYFKIDRVQGLIGYSKWGIPISFVNTRLAKKVAKRGHEMDLNYANSLGDTRNCLQIIMKLVVDK